MSGLRYAEVSQRELKFLDMTSLTVEEFGQLVPSFEEAFQERMNEWRLDGKRRSGRGYTTYANCPLPTPEDRLLFILVYLKTNVLQVVQGELFGMPQNKANQWIHTLLPVLQTTLRRLGDAPARSMEHLAQRLEQRMVSAEPEGQEAQSQDSPPLFAMMAPNGASSVPKMRLNRKAIIAARKNAIP
jgi:Helix-turn-helix of DDE superfamily endonuclease